MYTQFENWQQLTRDLESRITTKDTFVIDLQVAGYSQNPYLQGKPQKNGRILIELSSGNYMKPAPSDLQHRTLLGLGWNRPNGNEHPNYFMNMRSTEATKSTIARIFVDALQVGLGLNPSTIEA